MQLLVCPPCSSPKKKFLSRVDWERSVPRWSLLTVQHLSCNPSCSMFGRRRGPKISRCRCAYLITQRQKLTHPCSAFRPVRRSPQARPGCSERFQSNIASDQINLVKVDVNTKTLAYFLGIASSMRKINPRRYTRTIAAAILVLGSGASYYRHAKQQKQPAPEPVGRGYYRTLDKPSTTGNSTNMTVVQKFEVQCPFHRMALQNYIVIYIPT